MAECLSVMPVMNVYAKNAKGLYYSWKSFRTIYSIVVMLITFSFTILIIHWCLSGRLYFDNIGSYTFTYIYRPHIYMT